MSVEGIRDLAQELDYDYTDFVNYRVKFWGIHKGIDLSYLNLNVLPEHLYNISDIRILNITGNNLEDVWERSTKTFSLLRVLRADDNPFRCIPETILELKNLRELYLDNCQISKIHQDLPDLTDLRTLSIQSNKLDEFPNFHISYPPNLQMLHLDNNNLQEIHLDQNYLESLEILKVEQNKLSVFPDTSRNPKLWMIDFRGNPISEIDMNKLNSSVINSLSLSVRNIDMVTTELIIKLLEINQVIIEVQSEVEYNTLKERILRLARMTGDRKIVYYNPVRSELIISNMRESRFY